MKSSIIGVGVIVLIIGIALFAYGLVGTSGSGSTTTSTVSAVPISQRTIDADGTWSFGKTFTAGQVVTGQASISGFNSSAGTAFFYVQNESSFIAWAGCSPCTGVNQLNKTFTSSGSITFTWTVPATGAYYFVFDNEIYNQKAAATFSANATQAGTANGQPGSMTSPASEAGIALVVIGAIIAIVGVALKPRTRPAMQPEPKTETTTAPPTPPQNPPTTSP